MIGIASCWAAALWGLARGPVAGGPEIVVAATLFLVFGLPHGAVDHRVRGHGSWSFHIGYILSALVFAGLWTLAPSFGLVGFLALSAVHLGQGEAWERSSVPAWVALGLPWVALPVFARPELAWPLLESLGGLPVGIEWAERARPLWLGVSIAAAAAAAPRPRTLLRLSAVVAPMLTLHPVVGFAIPFSLLHGCDHLRRMQAHLQDPTLLRTWCRALPLTVLALGGAALALAGPVAPFLISFVGALTLPHAWVVERLRAAERTGDQGRASRSCVIGSNPLRSP
jgi:Brp/Blh family beta-carotene 15,15'-monooxygenase